VDEAKLCDDDRAFLRSGEEESTETEPATDADSNAGKKARTYANLATQANNCHSADEALALYKQFLADNSIDENERLSAKNNLPIWESRAAKKVVRFGTLWIDPEQVRKSKENAAALVAEAVELVESQQADKARKKLSDASREDPEGLRANFLSGLICVFGHRDLQAARQAFHECVRRQPYHVPSLNNLALVEIRLQKYGDAVAHWKTALDTATPSPEICQNIGRLVALSRTGACLVPSHALQKLGELQQGLSSHAQSGYSTSIGWLYMPFDSKGPNRWIVADKDMGGGDGRRTPRIGEDVCCMRCNGVGKVKCPNKLCTGGTVPAGTKVTAVAGTDPMSGRSYGIATPVRAKCRVCGGYGKVGCPDCRNGIEKNLIGR
jgi:hypothetical protein